MANGNTITRPAGFAILRSRKIFTIDEVVFTESGDLILLGAHSGEMEPYDAFLEKHLLPGGIFRKLDVFTETTKAFLHGDV